MKALFLFISALLIAVAANAQNQNKLSIEFIAGMNEFKMNDFNQYYIDSFALNYDLLEGGISSGQQYSLSLKYQPIGLFDIGIYGNYQFGQTNGGSQIILTDEFGVPTGSYKTDLSVRLQSIGAGISTTWYVSHILKLHEKESSFLQRFHFGLILNGGVGFSRSIIDLRDPMYPQFSAYNYYSSTDFQGQIGLMAEYDITKNPIITSIGIKGGYQLQMTNTLKDRQGNDWVVLGEYPVTLDFSGFFGAIYLKIGK